MVWGGSADFIFYGRGDFSEFLRVKHVVDFMGGNVAGKTPLKICHQIFTTFFTLKFAMIKEICHLVLTLGAISRNRVNPIRFARSSHNSTINECLIRIARISFAAPTFNLQGFCLLLKGDFASQ